MDKHFPYNASTWDDSILETLPDSLLLWFAADCAARGMVLRKTKKETGWDVVVATRLYSAGAINRATWKQVRDFFCADFSANFGGYAIQSLSTGGSLKDISSDISAYVGRVAQQCARDARIVAAQNKAEGESPGAVKVAAMNITRKWQIAHLRKLVELWDMCGERTPQLLLSGMCPTEPPDWRAELAYQKS